MTSQNRPQRAEQAGFPVNQRTVAIEGDGFEPVEVQGACLHVSLVRSGD